MTTANCPSCAGPIEFAIGSSQVVICPYCRTVVARSDRGVEDFGKVAALVNTGSPLRVGLPGKYRGVGFRLTGRTQMQHEAGGYWDEWYAAFDDGRWGWVAEAQGKYYVTFQTATNAPEYAYLDLGQTVPQVDNMVVQELGRAVLVSAEGEIPWKPMPNSAYLYADLSGPEGRFATIDYSEDQPLVFKGAESSLQELGLSGEAAAKKPRVAVQKLSCTNCGGPLNLVAPDEAQRIYCPNCGAGHDVTEGKLEPFQILKKERKVPLRIPLGKKGTIGGDEYVVAGFMRRGVKFDRWYYWTEYLLFNRNKGFRWLVNSDDHWSFVQTIGAGEVMDGGNQQAPAPRLIYEGQSFRLFQTAVAQVFYVVGEFYWRVEVGETVFTADYIKPPLGISKEVTQQGAREVSYSLARYMEPSEVEKIFGVTLPDPGTVGPMQPNPNPNLARLWMGMLLLTFLAAGFIFATRKGRDVYEQSHALNTSEAEQNWTGSVMNASRVYFTPSFELSGNQNVAVRASSGVSNNWVYVTGDLLNESTGALESFALPIEYYSGVEGGESWSEGSREHTIYISAPPKGRYSMRFEATWDARNAPNASLHLRVREGVFRLSHLFLTVLMISLIPGFVLFRHFSFEATRWKDSDFSPYASFTSDDEDDE